MPAGLQAESWWNSSLLPWAGTLPGPRASTTASAISASCCLALVARGLQRPWRNPAQPRTTTACPPSRASSGRCHLGKQEATRGHRQAPAHGGLRRSDCHRPRGALRRLGWHGGPGSTSNEGHRTLTRSNPVSASKLQLTRILPRLKQCMSPRRVTLEALGRVAQSCLACPRRSIRARQSRGGHGGGLGLSLFGALVAPGMASRSSQDMSSAMFAPSGLVAFWVRSKMR